MTLASRATGARHRPRVRGVAIALLAGGLPISYGAAPHVRLVWTAVLVTWLVMAVVLRWMTETRGVVIWLVAAALVGGAAVATASASLDPVAHRAIAVQWVLTFAVAPLALPWLVRTAVDVRLTIAAFVVGQTISALTADIGAFTGRTLLGSRILSGRVEGLAGHPNILGLMSAVVVLIWLAAVTDRSCTAAISAAGVVSAVALISSGSLSSFGALTAGLLVLVAVRRTPAVLVLKVALAIVVVLVASSVVADTTGITRSPLQRFRETSGQTDDVSSLRIRQQTWSYAIEHIEADPLSGVGFDNLSGGSYNGVTVVHDLPLHAWFQGGPLLFGGLAMILISGLATIAKSIRDRRDALATGVVAALIAFSLTSASFHQPYFWMLYIFAWLHSRPRPAHVADRARPGERTATRASV